MGKLSQEKGKRGELELASLLRRNGYQVERGGSLSYGEKPDLYGLRGIHIECKRRERLDLSKAMTQAEEDAHRFNDGFPTVFSRRSGEPWRVTMNLCDWLALYDAADL